MRNKVIIGNDHAGYDAKKRIKEYLSSENIDVIDVGCYSKDSVDYPRYAHDVANAVANWEGIDLGILICGSANGVAITANKHVGIRASVCYNHEVTTLAKEHGNANVLCFPASSFNGNDMVDFLDGYMNASFDGGRHERRVNQIDIK